ncbi:MAG: sigma-54 dependent transcriptional regulator [Desulfarculus sp.]|nr:sigma-54 dependent transcriptional regulator [Desulfarculus sp.]
MNARLRVLLVDDELAMRESLAAWLRQDGHQVTKAAGGLEALAELERQEFDLALVDIKMPGMDGLELLRRVKDAHPDTLVVIITAYGSIESAVEAMKAGASDYLLKPFDPEHLMLLLEKMARQRDLLRENSALRQRLNEGECIGFAGLVGQSPAMRAVFGQIEDAAPALAPVLITGETGTGKEMVARAIHNQGPRAFAPFVTINCGAVTETLLESELFGHERGAFTGAVKARRGRLEMADGGTLFLDEVGEISQKMQVALLRVLEEKRFQRVGGNQYLASDFRLISATNRDLPALIQQGRFRQDFFYRINVLAIAIPPLRERVEDIIPLAEHFLAYFAAQTGKANLVLDSRAQRALRAYPWPGNVRELRNVIERAVIVAQGSSVGLDKLTFLSPLPEADSSAMTLAEVELAHIRRVLKSQGGSVSATAGVLGIDRSTLSRKLKKAGLEPS